MYLPEKERRAIEAQSYQTTLGELAKRALYRERESAERAGVARAYADVRRGVRPAASSEPKPRQPAPRPAPKPAQKAKAAMAKTTPKKKPKLRSELGEVAREALLRQLPTELADIARREADDGLLHELARTYGAPMPSAMAVRMGTAQLERRTITEGSVTRFGVLVPKGTAPRAPKRPDKLPTEQRRAMRERMGVDAEHRVTVERNGVQSFGVRVTEAELAAGRTVDGGRITSKPKAKRAGLSALVSAAAKAGAL